MPGSVPLWNSLEIAKIAASLLTPAALAIFGLFIQRVSRRFEDRRWVNQKVVEKRLEIYDQLAPGLNDILCYFTFVGCWKDLDPPDVVRMKRDMDRKVHLARPLFPASFSTACQAFLHECFTRFGGPWGADSQLRTTTAGRIEVHPRPWNPDWACHFASEHAETEKIQQLYLAIMTEFTVCLGQLDFTPYNALTSRPARVQKDMDR